MYCTVYTVELNFLFFFQQIESIYQFEEKLPKRFLRKLYVPRLVIRPNSGSNTFLKKLTVRASQ